MSSMRRLLVDWYRTNHRDLPWRRTSDPYAIWISETMLQQTRVETVIPYYERFLDQLPDVRALATADLDEVLGLWAGLGYYSRARNLHAAAATVVDGFGGQLPRDAEALRTLPGVGRYTAGAIASIAFDRPAPIVDGNVTRVLSRLFGIREDAASARAKARLWDEAARLVRGPDPGTLNQALMELGATTCTPRAPACSACPLRRHCAARRAGDPEALPVVRRRSEPRRIRAAAAWVTRRGRALAVRRPSGGLLGGLWELPGGEIRRGESPTRALRRALRDCAGLALRRVEPVGVVEHLFTHRRLHLHVFRGEAAAGRVRRRGIERHLWLPAGELAALPQSAMTRKALHLLHKSAPGTARAASKRGARARAPRGT